MMMEEDEDIIFDQSGLLTNRVKPESEVRTVSSGFTAKALKTFCLCAAFFGLGLCIAIPGPTLLDLEARTHTDLEHISRIFTGRSVGYLGGSVLGGVLFDYLNQECLLSFSLMLTAIGTAAAPWSTNYIILMGLFACQGVSMGFLDTGGNVLCLNIWGINSGPYMQAMHFSFGVGAFVAPLIAEPFLAHVDINETNFTQIQYVPPSVNPTKLPSLLGIKDGGSANAANSRSARGAQHDRQRYFRSVGNASSGNNISGTNQIPTNGNKTSGVTRPISSGAHLSDNPKIADGSMVGKEISKNEQNKLKETQSSSEETEKGGIQLEEAGVAVNNETESGKGSASKSSAWTTTVQSTTKITTTTPTTTTSTTTKPTTTTKKPPSTSTQPPEGSIHAVVTGNFTVITDAPKAPTKNDSSTGIKAVVQQKVSDIIKYVGKMPNMMSEFTKVQFSFLIIAGILFITSLLFMCLCCCTTRTRSVRKDNQDYIIQKESKGFRVQILILLFVFYFLYVGMEVTYGGLIMTFSVKYLDWSKSEGTMLTSVFWGAFAIGRGLAIFLAKYFSPAIMLIVDLVLSCLALGGLVMALDSSHYILWFCTAMLGVGMASIFPTGITWAERYMHVTGKATAVFVVGSALGEMALPALTGFLFQTGGPMWLLYIMLGCGILSAVLYIIMQNLATNKGERYVKLSHHSSGDSLMNGTTPDLDTDDVELESVLSDNASESFVSRSGGARKKNSHSDENHSLMGNSSRHTRVKENGTRHKRKKRGPFSGKVSYKRI